ncbi:hypothetical protein J4429_03695 [Candidatus Pacearchaeota archaeon]|nr:hypothetical protein [Candidatus Pacearchaeota archaeon]
MNKKLVFFVASIFLIIVIISISFLIFKPILAGNTILTSQAIEDSKFIQEYTYTKAICNETNFCQDYEIQCRNKTLISSFPIAGAVIQHKPDWIDPRNKTDLCY